MYGYEFLSGQPHDLQTVLANAKQLNLEVVCNNNGIYEVSALPKDCPSVFTTMFKMENRAKLFIDNLGNDMMFFGDSDDGIKSISLGDNLLLDALYQYASKLCSASERKQVVYLIVTKNNEVIGGARHEDSSYDAAYDILVALLGGYVFDQHKMMCLNNMLRMDEVKSLIENANYIQPQHEWFCEQDLQILKELDHKDEHNDEDMVEILRIIELMNQSIQQESMFDNFLIGLA